MTTQEWQNIRRNVPNCWEWPEIWIGCAAGSICGVALLSLILHFIH